MSSLVSSFQPTLIHTAVYLAYLDVLISARLSITHYLRLITMYYLPPLLLVFLQPTRILAVKILVCPTLLLNARRSFLNYLWLTII
jgi:hypothetical protein